jgi:hypothetical protein
MSAPKNNKYAVGHGCPLRYIKEIHDEQVYKLCILGLVDKEIADVLMITEASLNNWKKRFPSFFESIKKGKRIANANVATRLYDRAMGFEHDDIELKVVSDGGRAGSHIESVPIRKIYPPDPTSAIFFLKNREKGLWRDKIDHEHSGNLDLNENITITFK